MKKNTFIILCLLFCFSGYAQEDWQCIYPDKKAYFENSQKKVYCVRIDSTSSNGTILYPLSDLCPMYLWECSSSIFDSWLSKYIKKNIIINNSIPEIYSLIRMFTWNSFDSCWTEWHVDGCAESHNYFPFHYVGLGGPYWSCCYQFGYKTCRDLVYYKKGDTEWGTPFSIPKYERENSFSIYPNPTTGELRIKNRMGIADQVCNDVRSIEIHDVYGRSILSHKSLMSHETSINIAHLPTGIYFVRIATETEEVVKKIVKQ